MNTCPNFRIRARAYRQIEVLRIEVVRMTKTTVTLNFVQYNRKYAMTSLPVIMLCTEKRFMVQAQYCSEWS